MSDVDFGDLVKAIIDAFDKDNNVATATGEQLDRLAEGMGIQRQNAAPATVECQHEWTDYYGLKECFKYCKKCDKKQQ